MSIPTSLIVVVLVLAWLMVLVPMVSRRREAVPEAEIAGGTFRVLRRSTEPMRRRPSFRRSSVSSEEGIPDADPELDPSELDEELLDVEDDEDDSDEYADDEYTEDELPLEHGAPAAEPTQRPRSTGSHPYRSPLASRPDARPGQPVEYQERAEYQEPAGHGASAEFDDDPGETQGDATGLDRTGLEEDGHLAGDQSPDGRPPGSPRPARILKADSRQSVAEEVDEVHLRPIPRRAGRGGYDPDAAEVARAYKYSRRRRVAVVLLLATVLFSAAAVLVNPVLWVGTAAFGVLLIAYLAYLRRQVRIEASIRERRSARLRRARQIRPEYDLERADSSVPRVSPVRGDMDVPQVPSTGYRRGREVVDLDDDDPAFDDLEYYQPLSYRRASGQ